MFGVTFVREVELELPPVFVVPEDEVLEELDVLDFESKERK